MLPGECILNIGTCAGETMKKILIVDDDHFLARVYKQALEKAGFEATYLLGGEKVLETVKELKPDLILLDILLPDKDGYAVLKELKAEVVTKPIPVIVLSALEQQEDLEKSRSLGAVDHLVKTAVGFRDVIQVIEKLLSQKP